MVKKFFSCCLTGILVVLVVLLGLRLTGVLSFHTVSGGSMLPNYSSGDYVITLNVIEPERGDVVVATSPTGTKVIKRVIALPGETIEIIDSKVYINGTYLEEDYLDDRYTVVLEDMDAITLGEDEYFLCGDNRDWSSDSRSYGPISASDIEGVVIVHLPLGGVQ